MNVIRIGLLLCAVVVLINWQNGFSQTPADAANDKPKIIVGVVIDQMRWDYLYRYKDRYTDGGFKRMLAEGFSYENAMINYAPTVTGPGHASVFTGSVPAIHGIAGNNWYDRELGRGVYCAEDETVHTVGITDSGRSRSPKNLLTTTIGDELKLSNNFRSKVIGISLKDRGAIFSAGHLADGAYWFDSSSGRFVTSTYYTDELPEWMAEFNGRELPKKYLERPWKPLFPLDTYKQSTDDEKSYENGIGGKESAVFPYDYSEKSEDYGIIRGDSPYGNSLVFEAAKAAIEGEDLGEDEFSDLLAVSFSTTDGLGHAVGPNAIEIEDMYLRLDRDFADFFDYLDHKFGEGSYLIFLTADHGVSHSPGFLKEHNLPTGIFGNELITDLNSNIEDRYGLPNLVIDASNYQLYLDQDAIIESGINRQELMNYIIHEVKKNEVVVDAIASEDLGTAPWPELVRNRFINGYHAKRSGDITLIFKPGWKGGSMSGASHGLWYPYDSHIPLVWMGWNIPHGESNRTVNMTDIAITITALLNIQMPSGSIGEPLIEITDQK